MMSSTHIESLIHPLKNSRGVTATMAAIMMTVLLAFGAAAIDIGHALVARNELQNVSDAAALAGARALGMIYTGLTPAAQQSYMLSAGDRAAIITQVQTAGAANQAAGVPISINAGDVQIGTWDPVTRVLAPTAAQPKDVRVISRRDGAANGPISTFLAQVVGMTSVNVSAVATAELSAVGSTAPGALNVPFAISQYYFTSGFGCGNVIEFYPSNGTPQSCAGWTSFDDPSHSDITLRNIINGMRTGTYTSPGTEAGMSSIDMSNGTLSNPTWTALINLYNSQKDASGGWDVFVPVYAGTDASSCHPSGFMPIVGYATARVTSVQGQPNAQILATIQCNVYAGNTSGGGPPFGPTFATIPGLVE
jgi:Flp pilus assembly protein TadG